MKVKTFYDNNTSTFSYIVIDEETNKSAVIDSVMDYDIYSGSVSTNSADQIIEYIKTHKLDNEWIIETHIHADHVSAAYYLQENIGGKTGIGLHIAKVLKFWVNIFETEIDTPLTGEQFDVLFNDNDTFYIGNLKVKVIHTPGHTPACVSYLINDSVFVGDTIFSPKIGTARCDFPGGSAATLYDSIQRIYELDDNTKLYLCHDYPAKEQPPLSLTTIKEQKKTNSMLKSNTTKEEFIELRETKDYGKEVPKLILPSIQTNMRSGNFGSPSSKGVKFIKVPLNIMNKDIGNFHKITSKYYVTTAKEVKDIKQAKEKGFKSIISFFSDNNVISLLKQAAEKENITFINIETSNDNTIIQEFKKYYESIDYPILGISHNMQHAINIWKTMRNK